MPSFRFETSEICDRLGALAAPGLVRRDRDGVAENTMASAETKLDYGIDAPGVIRNLFLAALVVFLVAIFFPTVHLGHVIFITRPMAWTTAPGLAAGGVLMLIYVKR